MHPIFSKLIIGLPISLLLVTTACSGGLESEARDALAANLKDAKSAEFRSLVESDRDTNDQKMICGEVNSKNSFGAYSGFVPFMAVVPDGDVQIANDANSTYILNELRNQGVCE